jgi:stearoyl-CoA desaturase (delta-9 desaturase)
MLTGYGHWWGYRNYSTRDNSRNLSPVGIFIAGDELHNNHHKDPANPKMSHHWFEFDSGWMFLKIFEFLRLAEIRKS